MKHDYKILKLNSTYIKDKNNSNKYQKLNKINLLIFKIQKKKISKKL